MSARLKADEISSIIKERIASYDLSVNVEETGKVISVADGVARVYGLKNVMAGEMVEFENGEKGLAQNLEESSVGVVILGKSDKIVEGTSVKRLGKLLRVPVGDAMIGRVVNSLGEPLDAKGMQLRVDLSKKKQKVSWLEKVFMNHFKLVSKLSML